MTFVDVLLMIPTLTGAGYLFYRSFIKKKGCGSCSVSDCPVKLLKPKRILIK